MAHIEARDREFHQRIVKNRVDPTAQSATNPVPDFYGTCFSKTRTHAPSSYHLYQHHDFISSANTDSTGLDSTGEKIGSLHQYRQWLRDQSRYKKKAKWLDA
jgi:import inner membrane translocase subunit TIM23